MHELIVVGFHNQYQAAEVLNELRRIDDDWVVDLDNAVAVYRDRHGKLRYQQSITYSVGEEAGWGQFGLLVRRPACDAFHGRRRRSGVRRSVAVGALAGGTLGVAGGVFDATWWKEAFRHLGRFCARGQHPDRAEDSAIFAWIQSSRSRDACQAVSRPWRPGPPYHAHARATEKLEAVLHGCV